MDKNNEISSLDSELLNSYVQRLGCDVVKQMISLYQEQSSIYLVDIESALQANNEQLWREHCHKMKGAAGSVGLKSLHARLVMMEKNTESANKKAQLLAELSRHNTQAIDDFNHWIAQIS